MELTAREERIYADGLRHGERRARERVDALVSVISRARDQLEGLEVARGLPKHVRRSIHKAVHLLAGGMR